MRKTGGVKGKAGCFLLLQASCDHSAQLWVNALNLKSRSRWAAGWLPMGEVRDVEALQQGTGQECKSCEGTGFKACEMCMGTGQVQLVVL